jgi:hypothetical protein
MGWVIKLNTLIGQFLQGQEWLLDRKPGPELGPIMAKLSVHAYERNSQVFNVATHILDCSECVRSGDGEDTNELGKQNTSAMMRVEGKLRKQHRFQVCEVANAWRVRVFDQDRVHDVWSG